MSEEEINRFINVIETTLNNDTIEKIDIQEWCQDIYEEYTSIPAIEFKTMLSNISKSVKKTAGKYLVNNITRLMCVLMIQYVNILHAIKINDDDLKNSCREKIKMVIDKINLLT